MMLKCPIGVFDSGYGGLTVLKEIVKELPQYDYLYLGDNARAPYGNRSFKTVYEYTLESVKWFFERGCELVILACNTASAKALRTIQQNDLPTLAPNKRVLGVIRPTAEVIGNFSITNNVGILATQGTVASNSYTLEIKKFFPQLNVHQEACPMWVPLIENNELQGPATSYFVKKNLDNIFDKENNLDVILLACTHYPLLKNIIKAHLPAAIKLLSQGEIVAKSLSDYLVRHPEIETKCSKTGQKLFCTTDSAADFDSHASIFFGEAIKSEQVQL